MTRILIAEGSDTGLTFNGNSWTYLSHLQLKPYKLHTVRIVHIKARGINHVIQSDIFCTLHIISTLNSIACLAGAYLPERYSALICNHEKGGKESLKY